MDEYGSFLGCSWWFRSSSSDSVVCVVEDVSKVGPAPSAVDQSSGEKERHFEVVDGVGVVFVVGS